MKPFQMHMHKSDNIYVVSKYCLPFTSLKNIECMEDKKRSKSGLTF